MKKFATITAICAAFSAFMFGCLSLHFMIERHDLMLIPFAIIGFVGSAVMWANRKPINTVDNASEMDATIKEMQNLLNKQADELNHARSLLK